MCHDLHHSRSDHIYHMVLVINKTAPDRSRSVWQLFRSVPPAPLLHVVLIKAQNDVVSAAVTQMFNRL